MKKSEAGPVPVPLMKREYYYTSKEMMKHDKK